MKKTILSIFVLGMAMVFVPNAEAATATNTEAVTETVQQWQQYPQRRSGRYDRRNDRNRGRWDNRNSRNRVRYETRTVRRGRYLYRETYRIYWDNGRMKSKRVSRVRIR